MLSRITLLSRTVITSFTKQYLISGWVIGTFLLTCFDSLNGQDDQINARFSSEYIQDNKGVKEFSSPETFELANILLVLSDWGQTDGSRNYILNTPYYHKVWDHFNEYRTHPIFDSLQRIDFSSFNDFIGFRENSTLFSFDGDELIESGMFDSWWNSRWLPNHFEAHLELIEDFAKRSGFRDFYENNHSFYRVQIEKMEQMVPLDQIYTWLETQFNEHFDTYQIYFSPLMRGNHSASIKHGLSFNALYIAISGPGLALNRSDSSGHLLVLRQVFTEIDHGYVDPESVNIMDTIKALLTNPSVWYGNEGGFYSQPFAFFNEYMTWAAMLLYLKDHFPENEFLQERQKTISNMVDSRKFIAFGEFANSLEKLYQNRKSGEKLSDLFIPVLHWARKFEERK